MPLRSVEAATRDDAIAAAREQFGPSARVVGVRRVRSGGVLGFFATERYVAEVAPDPLGIPSMPAPAPARPAGALTEDPDTGSLAAYGSPLASAAPARARPAPPRNGAAAWAAEAARVASAPRPELVTAGGGPRTGAAHALPADDARVDELASLLGAPSAPSAAVAAPAPPVVSPPAPRPGVARASFPRATREVPAPVPEVDDASDDASATGAPSPFTAALARMVAGDRDVQHAVREALATSDAAGSGNEHGGARASRPGSQAGRTAVWSRATHQEEETVGNQVIAPPSTSADERTEFPSWADEPSFPVGSSVDEVLVPEPAVTEPIAVAAAVSGPIAVAPAEATPAEAAPVSREEAIAEVLRAALAEGHSDDALAGILRKVVAGDSPQDALADPAVTEPPAAEVAADEPVAEAPAAEGRVVEAPVVEEPLVEEPLAEEPVATGLGAPAEPVVADATAPRFDLFAPVPAPAAATAVAPEGTSSPVDLWGPVVTPAPVRTEVPAPASDAGIWAEVTPTPVVVTPPLDAPACEAPADDVPLVATSLFDSPAAEVPVDEVPVDEDVELPELGAADLPQAGTAEPVPDDTTDDVAVAVAEALVEETGASLDLELAPALARTASDPAPVSRSMSMDATTVMPPLSLLPGAPSRGRGLPPVPPRTGRPPVPPAPSRGTSGAGPATAPPSELLATVTRLPVAPLMATPETPDMTELAELADLIEADGSGLLDTPHLPAAVPARPARVRIAPPSTPAEVVTRLAELGVPADLLGGTFTTDVAADGTYAALTRALGDRLPEAPELPTGTGDVLFVVGPGVETLRAARSLAATLRLDPDRVQWATRGDLVGLAPETSRMSTIDAALRRRQDASASGSVTIVAVDAPLRTDAYWMAQMLAIWSPVAVWAVVEATRKPEDLEHWLDGLARVDALIVQDTDLSADPAAVLDRLAAPVAVVDGVRATPHRWASVLCERLESAPA